MARIRVDGADYEVEEGRTILQALDDIGVLMKEVEIPHFCWHPKLSIDGSCRMCQVEVEGTPALQVACATPVQDGMVIRTDVERVRAAREGVMEFLLLNHPLDCPICDQAGECTLQDYAYSYGRSESRSREPRRAAKKRVDLGPTLVLDQERCILCRRCVRFCREISGTGELGIFGRGDRALLETFPGSPVDNPYSMNNADICPVGALTTKDFRFRVRVWRLESFDGICTGCSRGCNVHIDAAEGEVHRYRPRRNDEVNETWICDEGRLSSHRIDSADRIRHASIRDRTGLLVERSLAEAIDEVARRLRDILSVKGPGVIVGIASPQASNEELYLFKRFLRALGVEGLGFAVPRGETDALLKEAEKAPNAAGARALEIPGARVLLERIRGGGVDALIAMGSELLSLPGGEDMESYARVDSVILMESHHSALERVAQVVLPVRHAAEKFGSFTNSAGRVQRFFAAREPQGDALSQGEFIARLGAAMGLAGFDGVYDALAVNAELAREVPAFRGLDFDSLGPLGRPLAAPVGALADTVLADPDEREPQ